VHALFARKQAHAPILEWLCAEELVSQLQEGRFPLRLPLVPLPNRPALVPLEA
jgi:hypothetical protein